MFYIDKEIYNDDNKESYLHHHIGFIVWYIIFLGIIPFIIIKTGGIQGMRIYLPVIDLIANISSLSGKKNKQIFKDVYSLSPNNLISFISTNFVNLLALSGVAWNGVKVAMDKKSTIIGIHVMIIMYTMTYLLPTQGIPYVVKYLEKNFDDNFGFKYDKNKINPFGYLAGIIAIITLYFSESFLIYKYLSLYGE